MTVAGILTFDLRVMSRVNYHCATRTQTNFLSTGDSGRFLTFDLRFMSRVNYHCATGTQPNVIKHFFKIFSTGDSGWDLNH